ncbi:hypothetical protein CHS0354_029362 [Potamilus streckersoni]|uniref:Uncharacterized protein n=1 Tax=Potamilus streckersoni TaxID=2493646 RepID=A0AAE0STM4_9BIVA|nr:hypothetical protein CHS0354_029362 [Potamilus streckersoni]
MENKYHTDLKETIFISPNPPFAGPDGCFPSELCSMFVDADVVVVVFAVVVAVLDAVDPVSVAEPSSLSVGSSLLRLCPLPYHRFH